MTYLQLIREVGNVDLVDMYLKNQISSMELAREIGNSRTDLVIQYQEQNNQ